jgi:hypothetical protein
MKKVIISGICFLFMFLPANLFGEEIPEKISYQGVLSDKDGNLINGSYNITFRIYNQAVSDISTALWQEAHADIEIKKGVFGVMLGSLNPFNLDFKEPYWVGVSLNNAVELAPRLELTACSYAMTAKYVLEGQVVKGINGIKDEVTLVSGSGISIIQEGNNIKIESTTSEPTYDSGWFDIAIDNTYKKAIGFSGLPKIVTAYYKRANGQVFLWGNQNPGIIYMWVGYWTWVGKKAGVIIDFDENGYVYIRTPSPDDYRPAHIIHSGNYKNRNNDGTEAIQDDAVVQFRVKIWE